MATIARLGGDWAVSVLALAWRKGVGAAEALGVRRSRRDSFLAATSTSIVAHNGRFIKLDCVSPPPDIQEEREVWPDSREVRAALTLCTSR